jgi:hypothetical protein
LRPTPECSNTGKVFVYDHQDRAQVSEHRLELDPVHYLNNRLARRSSATQCDLTARRMGITHGAMVFGAVSLPQWMPAG